MKVLKKVGIVLFIVMSLFLLVGLLLPGKYTIKRSVEIANTPQVIFEFIGDLKSWGQWSSWQARDLEAAFTYSAKTQGIKSWMAWEGKKIGAGKLTITQYTPDAELHYSLEMFKPYSGTSRGAVAIEEKGEGSIVNWTHEIRAPYPFGRYVFALMGMDKKLGDKFQQGLDALKQVTERTAKETLPQVDIALVERENLYVFGKRITVKPEEGYAKIAAMHRELETYLQSAGIEYPDSGTVCQFFRRDANGFQIRPGIFLSKPVGDSKEKGYAAALLVGGTNAKVDYYGDPENIEPVYKSIRKWMKENQYVGTGEPWEYYPKNQGDSTGQHIIIWVPLRKSSYQDDSKVKS